MCRDGHCLEREGVSWIREEDTRGIREQRGLGGIVGQNVDLVHGPLFAVVGGNPGVRGEVHLHVPSIHLNRVSSRKGTGTHMVEVELNDLGTDGRVGTVFVGYGHRLVTGADGINWTSGGYCYCDIFLKYRLLLLRQQTCASDPLTI